MLEARLTFQAGFAPKFPFWYGLSWARTVQIVRAVLLASAMVATFGGRRLLICSIQGPGSRAWARTLRAP